MQGQETQNSCSQKLFLWHEGWGACSFLIDRQLHFFSGDEFNAKLHQIWLWTKFQEHLKRIVEHLHIYASLKNWRDLSVSPPYDVYKRLLVAVTGSLTMLTSSSWTGSRETERCFIYLIMQSRIIWKVNFVFFLKVRAFFIYETSL